MAGGGVSTLVVRIIGDSTGATNAINEVQGATDQMGQNTAETGRDMTAVWTTLGAAMGGCVLAASELEQATGALNQIYGENADEMLAWAESMNVYGLSTAQAANAAAILGGQLQNLGIDMDMTIQLVQGMVETAADMTAMYGGTMPEALAAFSSALKGNYEMLDNYAISITAATVEAEALEMQAAGVTFESKEQAKALAALSLIQEQTTAIQNAAEEEAESFASTTARLRAEITDLAAQIGGALTPALSTLFGGLANVTAGMANAITESGILNSVTVALTSVMDTLSDLLGPVLTPILEVLNSVLTVLSDIIDATLIPILDALNRAIQPVVAAIEAISAAVSDLIQWFENLIDVVLDAIDTLTFWNDTYTQTPNPEGMTAIANYGIVPMAARSGGTKAATPINITVNTGIGDPHAIASQIKKVLARDSDRLGRSR